mgnify:CR=1 FL=1
MAKKEKTEIKKSTNKKGIGQQIQKQIGKKLARKVLCEVFRLKPFPSREGRSAICTIFHCFTPLKY